MVESVQYGSEIKDRRVLHTRKTLVDSLTTLLKKKSFDDISVQEIADEANVNRNTFYLHYLDKSALLQAMTESRFRDLIERRGICLVDCRGALRAIALGVCDYLAEIGNCPGQLARLPLESAIISVVEGMFREGLGRHEIASGTDPALQSTTAAWAVFGAARLWLQTGCRIPAEEMAAKIEDLVKPVLLKGY